jgi:hypothetical protein
MTIEQRKIKEFREKFLYWVVLGSTLNDGSELRWNVGDGKLPNIEDIESFLLQTILETREEVCKELIPEEMPESEEPYLSWENGFNKCRQEIINKSKEII